MSHRSETQLFSLPLYPLQVSVPCPLSIFFSLNLTRNTPLGSFNVLHLSQYSLSFTIYIPLNLHAYQAICRYWARAGATRSPCRFPRRASKSSRFPTKPISSAPSSPTSWSRTPYPLPPSDSFMNILLIWRRDSLSRTIYADYFPFWSTLSRIANALGEVF